MASYKPVTAALRVLEVLSAVNRLNGQGTVREIHQQTDIDKATILRMLETLGSAGYIVRSTDAPTYQVTGKTLMLSASFDRHKTIANIVSPLLREFREEIGWPSDVALFDNDAMLVVETSRSSGPLSFNRSPGYRAPVLGTSLGLAYIANCPVDARKAFRHSILKDDAPWNRIAQNAGRFEQKMAEVRELGYATMDPTYSQREYMDRIFSIGVPLMYKEEVYASINVIYLRQALSAEKAKETVLPGLKRVAGEMGKALSCALSPVT